MQCTVSHRQLRVKDLPKVPTWQLERESNPRPFERKVSTLPMSYHALLLCKVVLPGRVASPPLNPPPFPVLGQAQTASWGCLRQSLVQAIVVNCHFEQFQRFLNYYCGGNLLTGSWLPWWCWLPHIPVFEWDRDPTGAYVPCWSPSKGAVRIRPGTSWWAPLHLEETSSWTYCIVLYYISKFIKRRSQ